LTHIKQQKFLLSRQLRRGYNKNCIISTALDVTEGIFAVLYVSIMGLTRCYKTTVFYIYFIYTYKKVTDSAKNRTFGSSLRAVTLETKTFLSAVKRDVGLYTYTKTLKCFYAYHV